MGTLDKPATINYKFEYKVVSISSTSNAATQQSALNTHGANSWELINIVTIGTNIFVYMKRLLYS